jgi:hypothetical protein
VLEILPGARERCIQPVVDPVFDSTHTIQLYAGRGTLDERIRFHFIVCGGRNAPSSRHAGRQVRLPHPEEERDIS